MALPAEPQRARLHLPQREAPGQWHLCGCALSNAPTRWYARPSLTRPLPRTLLPAAPEPLPPWLCPLVLPQLLAQEPVTCSASTAAAASSMPGGSPSAAASPATRATSASWTSAGSTVKTGAPARPPPPVRPPFSQQDCSQPLGPSPQTHCPLQANPQPLPCLLLCLLHPLSTAQGPAPCGRAGSAVGHGPTHTSSPQACPPAAAPRASRAPSAPSRCVRATAPTTAPALSTRATSPSADAYLASWATAASSVSWPPLGPRGRARGAGGPESLAWEPQA